MPPRHLLLALYVLVCAGAVLWPGYACLGNRIEPRVLGLPMSFAWNIGWVLSTFVVLVLFHRASERARAAEADRTRQAPRAEP